jgi:hypothetical protein
MARAHAHFTVVAIAVACSASLAFSQVQDFVYDTTAGATSTYTGDLTTGTLSLSHINGRSFRAQRVGGQAELGFFGIGGASLNGTLDLIQFNDNTPVGSGAGDTADFAGAMSGSDFQVFDEFGNSISGNLSVFELTDRTNSLIRPGIEGQGIIRDIVFSGPTFQDITTSDLETSGTIFTFTFVIETVPGDPVTLEEYLASSGLGGLAVEIETIEMRIKEFPLPSATGLAVAGLAPFVICAGRRRGS